MPDAAMASRHAITEFARDNGAVGQTLTDIALAVSEAVSNVIIHAYRDLPQPGVVSVEGEREGDAAARRRARRRAGDRAAPRQPRPRLRPLPDHSPVHAALEIRTRPEGGAELRMIFDLA